MNVEKCEMCELLACAHATGAQQMLQAAMWLDRAMRFNESANVDEAAAQISRLRPETERAWANFVEHRAEHQAPSS